MSTLSLLLRVCLSVLFVVAALAKLMDLPGTRAGIAGFGMGPRLAGILSVALPVTELCVALLLVLAPLPGAAAAAALLLMFSLVVVVNLLQGRAPACNCFGSMSETPISWRIAVRNMGLILVAALAFQLERLGQGSTAADDSAWLTQALSSVVAILCLVSVGLAWVILLLWRQQGRLLLSIDALTARLNHAQVPQFPSPSVGDKRYAATDLPVGSRAPGFSLGSMSGSIESLGELLGKGVPLILVFSHPKCGPCASLVPMIKQWREQFEEAVRFVVISSGPAEANAAKGLGAPLTVLLQQDREINEAFGVVVTPSAVRISRTGQIDSQVARGSHEISNLVRETVGPRIQLSLEMPSAGALGTLL